MLTPQELLEIVDTLHPQLDTLNQWITADLISRLMARLGRGEEFLLTGTDQWQLEVYKSAGGHYEALEREIKRFTKKTDAEVKAIFEDAGIRAWAADDAFYVAHGLESVPLAQSEYMIRLLTDTYQRTNGEIHNFTRTTAKASQQQLINVLDTAHFKVMSGAQSYTQAVKDAVNDIISNQAKVHYPTGHVDTIETAVLRAVRTGVGQASGNMAMQGMIERDWDLIRTSAHIGARYGDGGENPSNHFWWQGKLFSRTGKTPGYLLFEEATGYGTGEGLCGWNCRHSFGPGDPDHNPYADFDAEENKKVYDLSQQQRKAEARIRQQKLKVLGLREAVDAAEDTAVKATLQDEYNKAALKLQRYNQAYNSFCEDNNLHKLNDRITVAKWTRSEAAKATAAARKAQQ
ncbi:MAG: phage capsid protein [Clostridia bacterium]|nr:phage capsid protein [Clostridia bacterium]